jgi:magnesium transporter
MKILTIITAIFIPPTFFVGLWGMNFHNMPELDRDWGYPAALVFIFGLGLAMWIWFRVKKWF